MTWREFWQTTVANLRALFGGRAATYTPPPPMPEEPGDAAENAMAQPAYPAFPTVWDDPAPAPAARTAPAPTAWEPPIETQPAPVAAPEAETAEIETAQVTAEAEPVEPIQREPAPPPAEAIAQPDAMPEDAEEMPYGTPQPSRTPDDGREDGREDEQDGAQGDAHPQPQPTAETPSPPAAAEPNEPTLSMVLESVLFVASEPVTPAQLARSLQVSEAEILAELESLAEHYRASGRGLRLQLLNGKVQLVTAPSAAAYVEAFLNLDATTRLSGPALETLAVVAYRQPVTRAQVEAIRGVDCSGVLRSLVQRSLIAEVGRLESAGRPILYGVTELFMQHFGLADLKDLPPLEENEADQLWAAGLLADPDAGQLPSPESPPDDPAE